MRRRVAILVVGLLTTAAAAGAQSFGRNKVHYDNLDFQILQTPHFDIYYYPAEHDASVQAGRLAERWYARLSRMFDHAFTERQPIILYASHAQFTQTEVVPGLLDDSVGGVTEPELGRVVLPFAAGLGETDHVLGHELVHAFQRDILRQLHRSMSTLPLWFIEGMAEYVSVGRIDPNTAMWLRDAADDNDLPRIDQLDDPRWFPYRYGQALWAYLADRFGEDVVRKCLVSRAPGGAIGRIVAVTGVDQRRLSKDWHEAIRRLAGATGAEHARPDITAIVTSANGGRLNLGPSLSPDGASLVFLSERDQYSIDVFVADVATGRVRRKLLQMAGDPHFESLQFVESAGAWDPSGGRFVLAAMSDGRPVLSVFDMRSGRLVRDIPVPGVDQAFNPTWSPDGTRIAFSALKGGLSDLYVVDVGSGRVTPLTSDAFADLEPSWSPDGRLIAFATDRFSSSLDTLTFGSYRLGLLDVESGAIRELPSVPGAKNIDPHWSPDGAQLYFIADADAVSNVFRLDLSDGTLFQITSVSTGVSGVTALSPALSVASASDRLAFSVYRHGTYEIEALDANAAMGTSMARIPATRARSDQPASGAFRPSSVLHAIASGSNPVPSSLPDGDAFTSRPYHPALSLDRMVQPYLSAGGGSTGGFLRAGIGLSFGDMLGNQQLQTLLQVGRSLDDFIAQAAYVNRRSRWNWGLVGGEVPWLTGTVQSPLSTLDNGSGLTRQSDVFRQLHRQMAAVASYPFNRTKRLELTGGLDLISFDRETTTETFSPVDGRVVSASSQTVAAAPTARLVSTGAAFVYDTSVAGPTGPILGQRSRSGIEATFGSLSFATLTADYRRYLMPAHPFTIALRAMHVGRYGSGAGDPRLLPLVWTLRDVVRGYGDVGPESSSASYLAASRLLVGNAELRAPMSGPASRRSLFGSLPLDAILFADLGGFWTPQPQQSRFSWLYSVGAGVRFNAAGLVFELDAARPLDRSSHGWTFAFNFKPGF